MPFKKLRTSSISLLQKQRWLLPLVTMAMGTVLAISLLNGAPFLIQYLNAVLVGICAFTWGYSKRALDVPVWPPLAHLRRRQYRETWDALAASIVEPDENRLQSSAEEPLRAIRQLATPKSSDDVLEIACGMGRIGAALAPLVRSWTGADISPAMLAKASARLAPLPNVRLHQLNGHGLAGLADASFDLVYCVNVLPHLDEMDRWEYVREAFRVLRPGGRILIDGLDLASDSGWATFVTNADQFKDYERPPYLPTFSTAEELTIYLRRAGFQQATAHRERAPLVTVTGVKEG